MGFIIKKRVAAAYSMKRLAAAAADIEVKLSADTR